MTESIYRTLCAQNYIRYIHEHDTLLWCWNGSYSKSALECLTYTFSIQDINFHFAVLCFGQCLDIWC